MKINILNNWRRGLRRGVLSFIVFSLLLVLFTPLAASAVSAPQDTYTWIKNIGTPGCYTTTNISFYNLAIANSKMYATDSGNIYILDMNGVVLSKFAVTPSVAGGTSTQVFDIAVDAAGNIDVVMDSRDSGNVARYAVQKYSASGTLLQQFGSNGSGNGQFSTLQSIALDASGNIYVADAGNHRIQKFDSNGNYLSQFGSTGTGNGQFSLLESLTVDQSGAIYTTDKQAGATGRVQVFSSTGIYQSQFPLTSIAGTSGIQYMDIGRDTTGNTYVNVMSYTSSPTVTFYPTIQKYSSSGTLVTQFGSYGTGNGQFGGNAYGAIAIVSGGIYATDSSNYRIQKFDTNGVYQAQYTGNPADDPSQVCNPNAIARDAVGNLYLTDTARHNVKIYNPDGSLKMVLGSFGSGNGQFGSPIGITLDASGNIYVFDGTFARIQKFDSNGNYILQFGSAGSGNGQFSSAWTGSMAIDKNGDIYVVDNINGRIQKFDANGNYLSQFPVVATGADVTYPMAVALDASGTIYVTAIGQTSAGDLVNEVIKYDANGTAVSRFGSNGTGDGQFTTFMFGIAIDTVGDVYVSDSSAGRVEKFDSNGVYLSQFGNSGSHILSSPQGVVTDASGNVYVVEGNGSGGDISVWNAPILPGTPQNVAATPASSTSLTITWQPPVNAGSSLITGYKIQYRVKGTSTWIVATTTSPSTFSYTLTGLKAGTAYDVQVVAQNTLGLSTDIPSQANQGIVTTILSAGGLADTGSDVWTYLGIGGTLMLGAGILLRFRHIRLGSRR